MIKYDKNAFKTHQVRIHENIW